jgi:hypothetical protein
MNILMVLSGSIYLKNKILRTLATTILNFFNPKLTEDRENYLTFESPKDSFYKKSCIGYLNLRKPENIAAFLGRKLAPRYQGEVGIMYASKAAISNIPWVRLPSKCMTSSQKNYAWKRQATI